MDSFKFEMHRQVNLCYVDGWHFAPTVMYDCLRAWYNHDPYNEWCIIWDDYAPSSPDVIEAVDEFVKEKGLQLNEVGGWKWVGSKNYTENELEDLVKGENE
jgi:hypothetical protein